MKQACQREHLDAANQGYYEVIANMSSSWVTFHHHRGSVVCWSLVSSG